VLLEQGEGLSHGYPNEKGRRILDAIGTSVSREEERDLLNLMDAGPPQTEKYWAVLAAMLAEEPR
jgi:hypothetical protein